MEEGGNANWQEGGTAWPMDDDLNEHSALISEYDPYTGSFGGAGVSGSPANKKGDAMKTVLCTFTALVAVIASVFVALLLLHGGKHPDYAQYNARFADLLNRDGMKTSLEASAAFAHIAGSEEDQATAYNAAQVMEDAGFDSVEVVSYWPYLSYPLSRSVSWRPGKNKDVEYSAAMEEPEVEGDPASKGDKAVMTFLAYSTSGNVTAEYVYANYGRREDFEALAAANVATEGKIAIVRYGKNFRGLKVLGAEEAGCAGVIIYSDPAEDGAARGATYPDGPWRHPESVQRGSIQYITKYQGDPLTPEYAATKDAPRIAVEDSNLPKIPAVPLSAADAYPLLKALNGGIRINTSTDIGQQFVGGFPDIDYAVAPPAHTPAYRTPHIDLAVEMKAENTEIWDTIGMIKGKEAPDEWVVLGCHHDAWTFGALDPMSGHTVLMETARVFGELMKEGWRPRRTLVLASWDAEEYGLVGSTEWVEDNAEELSNKTVAYFNLDVPVNGPDFTANASPALKTLIYEVAQATAMPEDADNYFNASTLYEAWLAADARDLNQKYRPHIGYLGSGSDFTVWLQWLGVTSMDMSSGGFDQDPSKPKEVGLAYGTYHSNHDSIAYVKNQMDPNFSMFELMARVYGLLALRMANDDIVPLDMMEYALTLSEEMVLLRSHLADCFAHDPVAAKTADNALARSAAAVEMFLVAAAETDAEIKAVTANNARPPLDVAAALNDRLRRVERAFLAPGGIYGRGYYSHVGFAPGANKGYGSTVFPAVSEAGDNKDVEGVVIASQQLAEALERAATVLHQGRHEPPPAV